MTFKYTNNCIMLRSKKGQEKNGSRSRGYTGICEGEVRTVFDGVVMETLYEVTFGQSRCLTKVN